MIRRYWHAIIVQVKWHLIFNVQLRLWFTVSLIFHFLWGIVSSQQLLALAAPSFPPPYTMDGLFFAFAGPSLGFGGIVQFLAWLLMHFFFFMLIGNVAIRQLREQNNALISALGSRRKWWLGLVIAIIVLAVTYTGLILIGTMIGISTQLTWHTQQSLFFAQQGTWEAVATLLPLHLGVIIFSLIASTLAVMALIQAITALWKKQSIWGFVTVAILTLFIGLPALHNDNSVWTYWQPAAQSILSRHWPFEPRLPMFTVTASLTYNFLAIVVLTIIGSRLLSNFDFLGLEDDD